MKITNMITFLTNGWRQMAANGYGQFEENGEPYYVPSRNDEVTAEMLVDTHKLVRGEYDIEVNNDGSWRQR